MPQSRHATPALRHARRARPPAATALVLGALVAACAAGGDGAGGGAPQGVDVAIRPPSAVLAPLASLTFSATVSGSANLAVAWSAPDGGTVDGGGVYVAPQGVGQFRVVATSAADPSKSATAAVTVTSGGSVTDVGAQLAVLAGKRIYFGHNSVGGEILGPGHWVPFTPVGSTWGIAKLVADHPGSGVVLRNVDSSFPGAFVPGVLANTYIGTNYQPLTKITGTAGQQPSFDATMRGGSVPNADLAFMKFCYTDFSGTTDVNALFGAYRAALDKLQSDYPATVFVHVTAPLTTGAIADWDCDANGKREAFNALLRSTYGARVFDLAAAEATRADGTRATCTGQTGQHPALASDWNQDGGHVNQAGADLLAQKLVAFLANVR